MASYELAEDELAIIRNGVRETNAEANRWYEYEFAGKQRFDFALAIDPGTNVVHVRLNGPPALTPKVETAIAIFARFHLQPKA